MSARISSPSSMPTPRKLLPEVRLALSNEDLKISGTPAAVVISLIAAAHSRAWAALSITHGPAIKVSGRALPIVTSPMLKSAMRPRQKDRRPAGLGHLGQTCQLGRGFQRPNQPVRICARTAGQPSRTLRYRGVQPV